MNKMLPLMQREWLQHRFAWALLVLVPLALAMLLLSVGQVEFDSAWAHQNASQRSLWLSTISLLATTMAIFLVVGVTSLFITFGLARRDHADRSIEFWLSLPISHTQSLAVPLLVHLVLVPAAALLAGLAGGYVLSLLLVTRFVGLGDWFALPWGSLAPATLAFTLRLAAGLPLAMLWLSPLILLAMLANAFLRRWGVPVLAVALGVGSAVLQGVFGIYALTEALVRLIKGAGLSLAGASGQGLSLDDDKAPDVVLAGLPKWAAHDFVAAVQNLADPAFVGAMLASAALFMALVAWRARGASSGH
jgi:ABC-type transport system involved in multi-copper enzyme maturation permease subunit